MSLSHLTILQFVKVLTHSFDRISSLHHWVSDFVLPDQLLVFSDKLNSIMAKIAGLIFRYQKSVNIPDWLYNAPLNLENTASNCLVSCSALLSAPSQLYVCLNGNSFGTILGHMFGKVSNPNFSYLNTPNPNAS